MFGRLREQGHPRRFGLSANQNTRLESVSDRLFTLYCGKEQAVAATKSVVEQALFYRSLSLVYEEDGSPLLARQGAAAEQAREVLETRIDPEIVQTIAGAATIYFAGRNNGVAEELTLKTNEITRKKSDYLEGTYAVHGVEEVMDRGDVVVVIDPFPAEIEKFKKTLVDGVGMTGDRHQQPADDLPHDRRPGGGGLPDRAGAAGRLEHAGAGGRGAEDQPRPAPTGPQDRQRIPRLG